MPGSEKSPKTVDLRSDTLTLPTDEMLDAMRRAELGDDSRDGDPTVRRLEDASAALTGKEAAMFVASGTMSNLAALLSHTARGGEVLTDAGSHILRSEMGGIAQLAGLFHRVVPAHRGALDPAALREALNPQLTSNRLQTGLICMETSHNDAGGAIPPLSCLSQVNALARENGVPVHIDGARLFNAAIALGVPTKEISNHCNSIGFCLSKGLSAPVGSVLCGSKAFIDRARTFRRMAGGAMRQAGVLAAAGLVALEKMVDRLAEDHKRAATIARALHAIDPNLTDPKLVETNIVRIDLQKTGADAKSWTAALAAHDIRVGIWSSTSLRLVLHRHIDDDAAARTIAAFRTVHAQKAAPAKQSA